MMTGESAKIDVLIIGAGLSGIGTAVHLQRGCSDRKFLLLEAREAVGGTWDLFRYPGVRSDSDMYTLGFRFRPWTGAKAIADGSSILSYLHGTVAEHGLMPHIRFGHRAMTASWSSNTATWTVQVAVEGRSQMKTFTANFICMCAGYFSYRTDYLPTFPRAERFLGQIVHPQAWPEDLDYSGKRVVVIGSGATAMSLVPNMAKSTEHVTLLQRSPTYVVSRPELDAVALALRRLLPASWAYGVTRWKNAVLNSKVYKRTRTDPEFVKWHLIRLVRRALGPSYDVESHFTPGYDPWDQRLCLLPDGDLFKAINAGKASVVTAGISAFSREGIELDTGETLPADIIVTATGLRMVTLGDMTISVDGAVVDIARTWTYKGFAYSDIPNWISTFGYINASWTLRSDLIAGYTCRLLNRMKETGNSIATPRLRESDKDMVARPFIVGFSSGYMQRTMQLQPRQGDREPWTNSQDYFAEKKTIGRARIDDGVMRLSSHR